MKKVNLIGSIVVSVFLSLSVQAQDLPAGVYVQSIACSLNEGTSMAEAVEWARSVPRDETAPGQIYFRQAIFAPPFLENNDFVIASYYPSFSEMNARVQAGNSRPANRIRSGVRASDLYTCDVSTRTVALNRTVNPDNNDGFPGQVTLMSTRFCRLNQGATPADAFAFAQAVAAKYRSRGDNSLMQMYTRVLGPVGDTVAGSGLVIATVPATSAAYATRIDQPNQGLNVLEGLSIPMACDYPAMWRTNAIYRAGN